MKARALVAWNLRRIRVERDISQERLAFDAGVDRAYTGGIERQTHNPTVDVLERLAKVLNVSIGELFVQPPRGAPKPQVLRPGRKVSRAKKVKPEKAKTKKLVAARG
ncbi:MAG: XRE family transcriptional regulator [Xanthobacteraceae bacterium]|nr:MAG: XRE family transcriptional regulator [Xanthobacteraceae bacterium]